MIKVIDEKKNKEQDIIKNELEELKTLKAELKKELEKTKQINESMEKSLTQDESNKKKEIVLNPGEMLCPNCKANGIDKKMTLRHIKKYNGVEVYECTKCFCWLDKMPSKETHIEKLKQELAKLEGK